MNLLHADITEAVIGCAFEVHGILGYGYLEKVYRNSMHYELSSRGHSVQAEYPIKVKYKSAEVGEYFVDLFVDEKVLVELKTAAEYNKKDEAQLLNVLKATGVKVGVLINFGREKVEFHRFVY